ncbi:hypothetical protein Tco_0247951 [Tanacetum coccineum]
MMQARLSGEKQSLTLRTRPSRDWKSVNGEGSKDWSIHLFVSTKGGEGSNVPIDASIERVILASNGLWKDIATLGVVNLRYSGYTAVVKVEEREDDKKCLVELIDQLQKYYNEVALPKLVMQSYKYHLILLLTDLYIGLNVSISTNAQVGAGVRLINCCILDDAEIKAGDLITRLDPGDPQATRTTELLNLIYRPTNKEILEVHIFVGVLGMRSGKRKENGFLDSCTLHGIPTAPIGEQLVKFAAHCEIRIGRKKIRTDMVRIEKIVKSESGCEKD